MRGIPGVRAFKEMGLGLSCSLANHQTSRKDAARQALEDARGRKEQRQQQPLEILDADRDIPLNADDGLLYDGIGEAPAPAAPQRKRKRDASSAEAPAAPAVVDNRDEPAEPASAAPVLAARPTSHRPESDQDAEHSDSDASVSSTDEEAGYWMSISEEERQDNDVREAASDDDDHAGGIGTPPGFGPAPPGVEVELAEGLGDADLSHEPVLPRAAGQRVARPESIASWGTAGFRITYRAPAPGCTYGAWQGRCPFHQRSAVTKCTKSISMSNSTDENRERCLNMVKHWLLQAGRFDRAWKHQAWQPTSSETPGPDVLEAQAVALPLREYEADDVLDAQDVPPPAPKAATKSRSKAKAKPKRRPKGKAKSKAAVAGPAAAADVGARDSPGDEAASDPPSSDATSDTSDGNSSSSSSSSSSSESSESD